MTTFIKRSIIFLIIIGLVGLAVFRVFMNHKIEEMKKKGFITGAIPVEIIHPLEKPLQYKIQVIGNLLSSESVILKPEIPGRIVKIAFEEGVYLKKGDLCIGLDDEVYKSELAQAKSNLALSQKNLSRAQTLLSKQAGSEFNKDTALRDVEVNKAKVDLAEANYRKTKIIAPFDGFMGLRKVSLGAYANQGMELVNLESIDPIKVEFRLPEYALPYIKMGQKVNLSVDAYPNEIFQATLFAIDPKLDSKDRTVNAKATLPNADYRLKPGLFARLQLVLSEKPQALFLPENSIVPVGNDTFVYTFNEGKAHMQKVKMGLKEAQEIEILEGVTKESMVIATGQHKLFEGMAVEPLKTEVSAQGKSS
ncbi:MAG: efflux RND transporter periplasmic adaptor subunit [Alphaproteobacteria bacterium]|nr:efflux RND transporter periplasmic adaptor subunit [Alphaproteobacteria bacterium]